MFLPPYFCQGVVNISSSKLCMKTCLFITVLTSDVKQFLLPAKGCAEGIFSFVCAEVTFERLKYFTFSLVVIAILPPEV